MRYFIVDLEDRKEASIISKDAFNIFGRKLIPNDAVEVSFWRYVWHRIRNGL